MIVRCVQMIYMCVWRDSLANEKRKEEEKKSGKSDSSNTIRTHNMTTVNECEKHSGEYESEFNEQGRILKLWILLENRFYIWK